MKKITFIFLLLLISYNKSLSKEGIQQLNTKNDYNKSLNKEGIQQLDKTSLIKKISENLLYELQYIWANKETIEIQETNKAIANLQNLQKLLQNKEKYLEKLKLFEQAIHLELAYNDNIDQNSKHKEQIAENEYKAFINKIRKETNIIETHINNPTYPNNEDYKALFNLFKNIQKIFIEESLNNVDNIDLKELFLIQKMLHEYHEQIPYNTNFQCPSIQSNRHNPKPQSEEDRTSPELQIKPHNTEQHLSKISQKKQNNISSTKTNQSYIIGLCFLGIIILMAIDYYRQN